MLRFIRYLILAVVVVVLVVVSMANRGPVSVTMLPQDLADVVMWNATANVPLFIVALGGVAAGLLLGFVLEWLRESKHRREAAKRQKQVRTLKREMAQIKEAGKVDDTDEVLAILDRSTARKAS